MLRYYKVKVWPYKNQTLLYSENKTVRLGNITSRKNIRTLKNSTDWFNNISTVYFKNKFENGSADKIINICHKYNGDLLRKINIRKS